MLYYLVHRFGPGDELRFRKEEFATVPEAIIKASNLFSEGGDFVIEDDNGKIITNDQQIRNYCKVMGMP